MNQVRHPLTQHFQSENAAQLMDTSDLSEWPMANWSLGHLLGILVEYTPEWQPAGTSASELVERNYSRGSVEMKMIFIYVRILCGMWRRSTCHSCNTFLTTDCHLRNAPSGRSFRLHLSFWVSSALTPEWTVPTGQVVSFVAGPGVFGN